MEFQEILTRFCGNSYSTIREISANPKVRRIAEKIANFVVRHYSFFLGIASVMCLATDFKIFAVGFALGYFATRHYFSAGPGDFSCVTEDLSRTPMRRTVSFVSAIALRLLHPAFSILSFGFLAGHIVHLHYLKTNSLPQ